MMDILHCLMLSHKFVSLHSLFVTVHLVSVQPIKGMIMSHLTIPEYLLYTQRNLQL